MDPASDHPLSPEQAKAVAAIDPLLDSPDSVVRRVAAGALASLRAVTERLVSRLGDPDYAVVRAVSMSLECQRHAIPFLEAYLREPGARGRREAMSIVVGLWRRHGGLAPARELLAELLGDGDPAISEAAVLALAELGDPRALSPLCRLATRSEQAAPLVAHIVAILERTETEVPRAELEALRGLECPPQFDIEEEDRGGHLPYTRRVPAPAVELAPLRALVSRRLARPA